MDLSGNSHARIPSMAAVQDHSCIGQATPTVLTGGVRADLVKGQNLRHAPEACAGTGDALKEVPIFASGERGVEAADGQCQIPSQNAGVNRKMTVEGKIVEQILMVGAPARGSEDT